MQSLLNGVDLLAAADGLPNWLYNTVMFIKVLIGFSIIIFVHELGHFLAAKSVGIRVDRFAVGFGTRVLGYRKGEGVTFGNRPDYSADDLESKGYGETDYCLKALPIGGYVKMLGQDDIIINEDTGEMTLSDDPRSFTNKSVGKRMVVVTAGVVFNLLFAALLLIAVFMIGLDQPSPVIGWIEPDSPAQGVLFPEDRVKRVNGHRIYSFNEIRMETALGDDVAHLQIERNGELIDVEVATTKDEGAGVRVLHVDGNLTTELIAEGKAFGDLPNLLPDDRITHIDGQPVSGGLDVTQIFARSGGKVLKCTVQRPVEGKDDAFETVECYQRAMLFVLPSSFAAARSDNLMDDSHILGLRRRRSIEYVEPGGPADDAGIKSGDVIVSWASILNPNYAEIIAAIQARAGQELPVTVLRDGEEQSLVVVPKRPFKLFGEARAIVGVTFSLGAEETKPIVADVAPDSLFSDLNIPRGALLVSINGESVEDWFDVVDALKGAAGETAEISFSSAGEIVTGEVEVPDSLVNELDLPPSVVVWSVDGEKTVKTGGENGAVVEVAVAQNPLALAELFKNKIGETVTIRYSPSLTESVREATFTIREENTDPWQMRISYFLNARMFKQQTEIVSAGGNPIVAVQMSSRYVVNVLRQVYTLLSKLASRRVGTQSVAGPVGIFKMAYKSAELGYAQLMLFLAFISVNLAVINFLPMPVMDGGLMLFLIIEKIKGKPLSLKAQMVSTMVGVAAIILIGLAVTIQDIGRFF